jgi:hypothetical protein
VCSYLAAAEVANLVTVFPAAGTPAGTVVVRAAALRVHGEAGTTEPRTRIDTEHKVRNNPECRKHLKYAVLDRWSA